MKENSLYIFFLILLSAADFSPDAPMHVHVLHQFLHSSRRCRSSHSSDLQIRYCFIYQVFFFSELKHWADWTFHEFPVQWSIAALFLGGMKFCRSLQASCNGAGVKARVEKQNAEHSAGTLRRLKWTQATCPGCQKCPLSQDTNLMYDRAYGEKRNYSTTHLKNKWIEVITKPKDHFWARFLHWFVTESFSRDRNRDAALFIALSLSSALAFWEGKKLQEESFPLSQLRELIFKFFAALHASDTQIKPHRITFTSHTADFSEAAPRCRVHVILSKFIVKRWIKSMPERGSDRALFVSRGHVITLRSRRGVQSEWRRGFNFSLRWTQFPATWKYNKIIIPK